jgi:hypothetical protein
MLLTVQRSPISRSVGLGSLAAINAESYVVFELLNQKVLLLRLNNVY